MIWARPCRSADTFHNFVAQGSALTAWTLPRRWNRYGTDTKINEDYDTLDDFSRLEYAVVTSGTFDGVHLGHQKILSRLKEVAEKNAGETVVITFWPHPRLVLKPDDQSLKLLNTFEKKPDS